MHKSCTFVRNRKRGLPSGTRQPPIVNLKVTTKMQKIEIAQTNVFEEQAKKFANSKLANRLQEKYKAKPYEERRKGLYTLSQIGSWLCNGLAVIASASFVFGFCYSLLAKIDFIPYPTVLALLVSFGGLVFIEGLKRATVPDLFKDVFQYGFKGAYIVRVLAIVGLIGVSTFFSYKGGHEFVELVMNAPTYTEPSDKTADNIRDRYKGKIADAKKNAEGYRTAKLWHGRLSDQSTKEYNRLLDNVATLEAEENREVQALQEDNREAKRLARLDFEAEQKAYQSKLKGRGTGFAGFSIFGEILFLFFVWFMERYDYKTATQYAVLVAQQQEQEAANTAPATIPPATQVLYTTPLPYPPQPPHTGQNGQHVTGSTAFAERRPIGFHSHAHKVPEDLLQQPTQGVHKTERQVYGDKETSFVYEDKHTILHKGEKGHKRYTLARVKNYQKTYTDRAEKAKEQGKKRVAEHNTKKVKYWQEREVELLKKS